MKTNVYAVYDSAIKSFMAPFFMQTDGQAIRAFSDTVNAVPPTLVSKHPEQFTLYNLGTFDDESGELTPGKQTALAKAIELKSESLSSLDDVLARMLEIEKQLEIK